MNQTDQATPRGSVTGGRRLTAKGTRTRGRLLRAAEDVFCQMGYHDASIVKVTEAAGVAQGTFYLYFDGKQAVFDELVDDLNRRVRQAMVTASAREPDRARAERAGFAAFFSFTAEHPALYRVIRQAEFVSPGAMRRHYEQILHGYVDGLRSAMGAGEVVQADPEVLAWALMGVGEMVGMRWVLWQDPSAASAPEEPPGRGRVPDAVFDEVMALVYRALGLSPPAPDQPPEGSP